MKRRIAFILSALLAVPAFASTPPGPPWSDTAPSSTATGDTYSWGRNAVGGVALGHGKPTVQIYVVDNGVGNHNDLNVTRIPNGYPVTDIGCYAHGTHVAGVIGAALGNGPSAGILAGAPIFSVSTLTHDIVVNGTTYPCGDPGSLTPDSIANALLVVYQHIPANTPAVVNLSINPQVSSGPQADAWRPGGVVYNRIVQLTTPNPSTGYLGAVVVESAGNQFLNACQFAYTNNSGSADPADGVLVVGGLDQNGNPVQPRDPAFPHMLTGYSNFGNGEPGSNFGPCVDVWAPSKQIFSSWGSSTDFNLASPSTFQDSRTSHNAIPLEGTSVAAPHVTAIAATIWQRYPTLNSHQVESYVRANMIALATHDFAGSPISMPFNPVAASADQVVLGMYGSILHRGADAGGRAFWDAEVERLHDLGMDRHEAYKSVAKQFFFGGEYVGDGFSDTQYVMDLYIALFGRNADSGGLNYWLGQMASGLNREAVFASFVSNAEYYNLITSLLGPSTEAPVVGIFADNYRAAHGYDPSLQDFVSLAGALCSAQGSGYPTLINQANAEMRSYFNSANYSARNRNDKQYVADLYEALFRRDVDVGGFNFWSATGVQTYGRATVLELMLQSGEWTNRVNAAVGHPCP